MVAERRERTDLYAGPLTEMQRKQLPGLERVGSYVCERKEDGMWCAMSVDIGGARYHKFESRTGLECDGSDIVGLEGIDMGSVGRGTVLVGELEASSEVATKSFQKLGHRRLHLFDVIFYRGEDLRDRLLRDRVALLRSTIWYAIPRDTQQRVLLVERTQEGFVAFYDNVIKSGGEGVVVKPLLKSGRPRRKDGKVEDWIRVKPWRTDDYVIVGFEYTEKEQLTARLALYRNGKYHVVMRHPIADLELDKSGERLKQHMMVVEMYGREMYDSGAIRHAQFRRYRKDKRPEDCTGERRLVGDKPE